MYVWRGVHTEDLFALREVEKEAGPNEVLRENRGPQGPVPRTQGSVLGTILRVQGPVPRSSGNCRISELFQKNLRRFVSVAGARLLLTSTLSLKRIQP